MNHDEFFITQTDEDLHHLKAGDEEKLIAGYVRSEYSRFKTAREQVEDDWLEYWSLYLGTPEAVAHQRDQVIRTVGEVNTDWRHKINVGKAFEMVETIHGYLMAAIFPNNEWFNAVPVNPGYLELARVVKKFVANKMYDSDFRAHFAAFLRQLLITGNSVLALPWRYETKKWKKNVKVERAVSDMFLSEFGKKVEWETVEEERIMRNHPDFETLDMFDVYLDPTAAVPNDAAFIRRMQKTKAEVIQLITDGYYENITPYDVCCLSPTNTGVEDDEKRTLRRFQGVETPNPYSLSDTVEVIEYWGDIHLDDESYHDVVATVIGGELVRHESNPYWCGKPFIVGTCIPITQTPYAIGVLQPNAGLLHQLNIITNQRLDNLELAVDEMWTLKADGVLQPEDVYTQPGKVFLVSEHDDLQPVARSQNNFTVTYQEASVLETSIDRNAGTGALISANNARSGERVTAAEIQAVRDAGGNRLSNLHKHIEDTSLYPILSKVFRLMQQFVTDPEVVRVAGTEPGEFVYYRVGADQLAYEFILRPVGADHVTDKERYIQDRLSFLQAVAQVPQMAQLINYEAILYDLVQHFGFDDPDSYLSRQSQNGAVPGTQGVPQAGGTPGEVPLPPNPQQQFLEQMQQLGGEPLKGAMSNQLLADGGVQFAQDATGIDISSQVTPPMPLLPE